MTNPIKADVSGLRETTKNARRDTGFLREIAVLDPATGAQVLVARLYYPGTVMRCSVWISSRGNGTYGRGQGEAGGGGYHKASAALASALSDAGVILSRCISGVGDQAMRDACEATARAVTGKRRFIVHEAHA
jgi:hypothetical protein